jgi:hypothetical protein
MLDRDPDLYLSSLQKAFMLRAEGSQLLLPPYFYFSAAREAVVARIVAIDSLSAQFALLAQEPHRTERKRKENQIFFDFFANGSSAFESFCFGSYFIAVAVGRATYDANLNLKTIRPGKTWKLFEQFAPADDFTLRLARCLDSQDYKRLDAMRNMLVHRLVPGRNIQASTHTDQPDVIDLAQWFEGDMSRIGDGVGLPQSPLTFSLEPDALFKVRDWIDKELEGLSSALCALASAHGLS